MKHGSREKRIRQSTELAPREDNDVFFSIVLRDSERPGTSFFSSGLRLPKFNPFIWGRTGICSNAAFKGLQQLRADVSYFALQQGIVTRNADVPYTANGKQGHG